MSSVDQRLLGSTGASFLKNTDWLVYELDGHQYSFVDNEVYMSVLKSDHLEAMRIYWSELLYRAHLAASTSIIRSRRWIAGAIVGFTQLNFLIYAAAMRGFLESAADTVSALLPVPVTLAEHYQMIENALLKHPSDKIAESKELEDTLIHYSHGRRVQRGEEAPKSHQAKTVREYLGVLERGIPGVSQIYMLLCDAVHPGATSVHYLLDGTTGSDLRLQLGTEADEKMIKWFTEEFQKLMVPILMFAFNPGIVTLQVLNFFNLPTVHTLGMTRWSLGACPSNILRQA